MRSDLPKGVVVVDCVSIDFVDKDVIEVCRFEDLLLLLNGGLVLFRRKPSYYVISDGVVYLWREIP